MTRRFGSRLFIAALAIAFQIIASGAAHAHGLLVSGSVVCVEGTPAISFTVTSFSLNLFDGENPQVDVLVNGVKVATGAFALPVNQFSGSVPAPSGDTAVLNAIAVGTWGDGVPGGQSAAETVTLTIPSDCAPPPTSTGRFTGGGFQIRVGEARVTRGLTVHCDLLLSNNLEVNWGGNKFHMEEHLVTTECSDDPAIIQFPPAAPLDTLIGVGRGRYNNEGGYTIEFTFVDYGEPGSSDRAALRIYQTANPANVVLNIPLQLLSGGNLQAHYDQPHR
jgi:hypothetical protein